MEKIKKIIFKEAKAHQLNYGGCLKHTSSWQKIQLQHNQQLAYCMTTYQINKANVTINSCPLNASKFKKFYATITDCKLHDKFMI